MHKESAVAKKAGRQPTHKEPAASNRPPAPAGHRTVSQDRSFTALLPAATAAVSAASKAMRYSAYTALVLPPVAPCTAALPAPPEAANEHLSAVPSAPVAADEYGIAIRTSYDEDNRYLYT